MFPRYRRMVYFKTESTFYDGALYTIEIQNFFIFFK